MNIAPRPDLPWRIAHRGYHARCVENTIEAFAAAYGLGCDMVEFDVQLSSDGVPVIFHDDDLRRLARRDASVSALTAHELQRLDLRDPVTGALGRVPTLAAFLEEFGSFPFYLEIKVPTEQANVPAYWRDLTAKVIASLSAKPPHALTFVAGFHFEAMRYALRQFGFRRAALIHENAESLRQALTLAASDSLSKRIYDSIPFSVFQEMRRSKTDLRADRLLLWNVKGRKEFREARNAGVAGIVADDVPALLEATAP